MVEYDNKFRELQITITQKYEVEASRKITTYEQNIQNLMRELENMKMKLTEYENLRINYEN
jgi:dynactin complex subunit